jgi:C1A family cysteine protease
LPTEEDYGTYKAADGRCHVDSIPSSKVHAELSSYVNITSGDCYAVMDMLKEYGPLAVAIDASHRAFSFYSSGVYYEPTCGNTNDDLDHAVLAVGFGTDPVGGDYWIIKNSWSTHYGDQGYVKMSRKENNCGVATDANLPILKKGK